LNKHIQRFKNLIIDRPLVEIEDTLEQEGPKQAIKKAVPLLAAGLVAVVALVLVLAMVVTGLGALWKRIAVPVVIAVVIIASYLENRKSAVGPTVIKEPTMQQYVTVGNIVKMAAKRVAPSLGLSPIYEETDIKAAKDERIIPYGKCWLLKYRFLKKSGVEIVDTDIAEQVFSNEIQAVLDNENPAGFDTVRFVYGGVDESILQVDRVTQSRAYLYVYCCYASEDYFNQRKREDGENDETDTSDNEF